MVSKELEVKDLRVVFINQSNIRSRSMSLGLMESIFEAEILKESNDNV